MEQYLHRQRGRRSLQAGSHYLSGQQSLSSGRRKQRVFWLRTFFDGFIAAGLLFLPERYFLRLQDLLFALLVSLQQGVWLDFTAVELLAKLWRAYAGAALLEEGLRFILLYRLLCRSPEQQVERSSAAARPASPAVLVVIATGLAWGLGFASAENLFYALRFGPQSLYWRLLSAVPLHLGLGAWAALALQNAAHPAAGLNPATNKGINKGAVTRAFLLAVFLHGSYNAALVLASPVLIVALAALIALAVLIAAVRYG